MPDGNSWGIIFGKLVFINIKLALSYVMNLTHRQYKYLKLIWHLEARYGRARIKQIALELNVKPPTVLTMFRQLQQLKYIIYDRMNGARLTKAGKDEAENLIRKHRLIESFLRQVLNIDEPLLHEEAERLDLVMSDRLIMRIDDFLGYPRTDPHGSIIPPASGKEKDYSLTEMETDVRFKVVKVPMRGREGDFCHMNGFLPGTTWKISQIGPGGESYLIENNTQNFLAVSDHLAEKIRVSLIKKAVK